MVLGPIQGHSYEQMALILGTNEEVIKGRLHRARENIRDFLKEDR
jgi:DNA-directed RNA polymerase specialized sigma24 family protein